MIEKNKSNNLAVCIICIDICVAYLLRYKEHKEVGLMDKADK